MNRWNHRGLENLNSDNLFDGPQEWTDEDEEQFLETNDNDNESEDLNK
ncbi:hypothetical protein BLA29_015445 [Euroglyphus maynei]|uniref:Uncharacterized protein n=1 Tax=Euroglyphus maynei TaxID=6958 RepID=A0A1Y3B6M3_EURMA|nr:hypothetical protein BLA29_015445 [Euroglyphus maynei]